MNQAACIVADGGFSWRAILTHRKSHERLKARARRRVARLLEPRYPGHGIDARVRRWVITDWLVMRLMRSYEKKFDQRTRKYRSPYTLHGVR